MSRMSRKSGRRSGRPTITQKSAIGCEVFGITYRTYKRGRCSGLYPEHPDCPTITQKPAVGSLPDKGWSGRVSTVGRGARPPKVAKLPDNHMKARFRGVRDCIPNFQTARQSHVSPPPVPSLISKILREGGPGRVFNL